MSTVTPFRTIPSTLAPNGRNTVATTPTSGLRRGTSGNPSFTPRVVDPHPLTPQLNALAATVNGNTLTLSNILLEQKKIMDAVKELQQRSFSIENSVFKIFGLNPCQSFAGIGTEEFVARFLPVVKVERHSIPNYHLYVAILRRYCRTVDASKKNTYKGFERWLEANFANGSPSAEDLQLVYNEEERLLNPPHQSEQGILIASGESYLEPCLEPASPYQYEADEQ
ncbi:hypothetical protein EMCRGX_G029968 [Ephydatia muelleri]